MAFVLDSAPFPLTPQNCYTAFAKVAKMLRAIKTKKKKKTQKGKKIKVEKGPTQILAFTGRPKQARVYFLV